MTTELHLLRLSIFGTTPTQSPPEFKNSLNGGRRDGPKHFFDVFLGDTKVDLPFFQR